MSLSAGTYWLAFEVRDANDFRGGIPYSSPNPLDNHAFWSEGSYKNQYPFLMNVGIKIHGELEPPPAILVEIDIKPGSCPNALNPKARGVLPVAIVSGGGYDISQLICTLESVGAVKYEELDSTQEYEEGEEGCDGCFDAEENLNCDTDGDLVDDAYCGDGILDLVLYFSMPEVAVTLEDYVRGDCVELTLECTDIAGNVYTGTDYVVIK